FSSRRRHTRFSRDWSSDVCSSDLVKWFDAERGFGFIASEDGDEVFLHASALPAGVTAPRPGTRVEFGVAEGRRGPQALSVTVLDPLPSVAKAQHKTAEDMAVIIEDLIKL